MLHIILLECALELIPPQLTSLKVIQKHASRRKKKPNEILLDQTHHGQAMTILEKHEKRGRPDIVFLSLLTILETPLCKEGLLKIYLHLLDGTIIEVNPSVRLPRNYDRFVGLIEQLLQNGKVPLDGIPLLTVTEINLSTLLSEIEKNTEKPVIILTKDGGNPTTISELEQLFPTDISIPIIVGIGAFPHGNFSKEITNLFPVHLEFDEEIMMAWHVCAEVLWAYSWKTGIIGKRYRKSQDIE
jgi:rRNA small subunit pseudouridine methyltransferase Nep1